MTREKLNEILSKHKLWLKGEDGGSCANLSRANLLSAKRKSARFSVAVKITAILRKKSQTA